MTRPEDKARELIDQRLRKNGWLIQGMTQFSPAESRGVAVREFPTDTGPADYVLLVNHEPVGVIEAKRDEEGQRITEHEAQTECYAEATLKWRKTGRPLRVLVEATDQIIRFTDGLDSMPRSRALFHFFQPQQLAKWLAFPCTFRGRLASEMPASPEAGLRDCRVSAVKGLEKSSAENRPRSQVPMATGAGRTFTALTSDFRLLKFGGAKRVLFLVDNRPATRSSDAEAPNGMPRTAGCLA